MRREHLQNIISLLCDNRNYELALLTDKEARCFPIDKYWAVLGEEAPEVFMETRRPRNSKESLYFHITEPSIARAFRDYFAYLWGQIKRDSKDKRRVVSYLQWHLKQLPPA